MRVRGWSSAAAALVPPCALLLSRANSTWAAPATLFAGEKSGVVDQRLAVVVPCHDGDLERALASVARWPKACSPVTLSNVDLILYKAEGDEESAETILPALQETAGQCFANTKIVYGHLADEVSRSVCFLSCGGSHVRTDKSASVSCMQCMYVDAAGKMRPRG